MTQKRRKEDNTIMSIKNIIVIVQLVILIAGMGGQWFVMKYRLDEVEQKEFNPEKVRELIKEELSDIDKRMLDRFNVLDDKMEIGRDHRLKKFNSIDKKITDIERALLRRNIL